jgi:hypothetical protein
MDLTSWLHRNFLVKDVLREVEYHFDCPICGHPSFYFNIGKKVGHCHRASCTYNPTLKTLIEKVGYGPSESASTFFFQDTPGPTPKPEISLPQSDPVAFYGPEREVLTSYPDVLNRLMFNRNLRVEDIMKWNISTDGWKIYVPVYEKGILVSYIGRIIWGLERSGDKKYKYPSGSNIGEYFFGWDEAKRWDRLTLVENTFNSIWLRDELKCSTNFGSHLSKIQIDKIAKGSDIKSVVFLWDEKAERPAEKAVRALRNRGIYSSFCAIIGQPDRYEKETLIGWVEEARSQALEGGDLCFKTY